MLENLFFEELKYLNAGHDFVIGVDEAGRGPLAGPVVAAAAIPMKIDYLAGCGEISKIRDSKTLSWNQKNKLFEFIKKNFFVGVGICDHKTIDRVNILEATFLAMKKALSDLAHNFGQDTKMANPMILIDGNKKLPNFSHEQIAIVDGDNKVKSISAASIIAKVTRDRIMLEMHEKYPEYRFDLHKGYGTKLHIDALHQHGPCEIHRMSFEPVCSLSKRKNDVSI